MGLRLTYFGLILLVTGLLWIRVIEAGPKPGPAKESSLKVIYYQPSDESPFNTKGKTVLIKFNRPVKVTSAKALVAYPINDQGEMVGPLVNVKYLESFFGKKEAHVFELTKGLESCQLYRFSIRKSYVQDDYGDKMKKDFDWDYQHLSGACLIGPKTITSNYEISGVSCTSTNCTWKEVHCPPGQLVSQIWISYDGSPSLTYPHHIKIGCSTPEGLQSYSAKNEDELIPVIGSGEVITKSHSSPGYAYYGLREKDCVFSPEVFGTLTVSVSDAEPLKKKLDLKSGLIEFDPGNSPAKPSVDLGGTLDVGECMVRDMGCPQGYEEDYTKKDRVMVGLKAGALSGGKIREINSICQQLKIGKP